MVDPQAPPVGDDPGGYSTFWYENASIGENVRTSLIIYPKNGQLPARIEGSAEHTANKVGAMFLVSVQFSQFWGYWRRWTGGSWFIRRCLIGFNAGPPFTGGGYNANVQIFQNKDRGHYD